MYLGLVEKADPMILCASLLYQRVRQLLIGGREELFVSFMALKGQIFYRHHLLLLHCGAIVVEHHGVLPWPINEKYTLGRLAESLVVLLLTKSELAMQ